MAALSLSWCHTFAFGGILVVVCAPLLVTVGAADTNSLETAVRDAATEYLAHYGDILSGNPCDISQLISQPCGFAHQGQNFDYRVGSVPPTRDPSHLARLCAATRLQDAWTNLATTLPGVANSLYTIDTSGNFVIRYPNRAAQQETCDISADERTSQAYIETVSSPKTVAVVNLNNGASPTAGDGGADSYQVMEILLNMTLSDQDQITLFSPGLNFTGFSSFVPANQENINLILDRLSTSASSNDSSLRLLSEGIELLLREADASCYHALVVLLDSEMLFSDVLQNMIANASQNSDKLTVFLYILDTLSPEDFTNASRRFCDSRTVIETLGGTSGTWLRSLLVNYMNYFYYGPPNISDSNVVWVRNNTGLFSGELVQTACLPLVDRNLATVSTTGTLLGTLCVDFLDPQLTTSNQVPSPCPAAQPDVFEFSFLRLAYEPSPWPRRVYHCENIIPSPSYQLDGNYLNLLEEFLRADSLIGHFSFEIVLSNSSICASIQGRPLTTCLGAGVSPEVYGIQDSNFLQPVSLSASSLLWYQALEDMLPISTTPFDNLNNSLPLWRSICASAYLEGPWRDSLPSTVIPSTYTYGDYASGYIRRFPGYQDGGNTCSNTENLDARLQPWFTSAASGPKAVMVLVDVQYNFENSIADIRTAATAILNSLSHRDAFNIIPTTQRSAFQNVPLALATQETVATAVDYINQLDFTSGSRDPNAAIQLAVQYLNSSLEDTQANFVFILLTDNSFLDPTAFQFATMLHSHIPFFLENSIRVFTYLFSEFQEGTLLKNTSCTTGGLYDRLYNLTNLEMAQRATSYYHFYAAGVQPISASWSEYFTEELTGLNSTRVCRPIYRSPQSTGGGEFNTLLGVTCISVAVRSLSAAQLQDLRARIYSPRLQVMTPNLTFTQENTLRGIHMCDIVTATSAESFRYRTENTVRLFRTTAENAYSMVTVPGISSCPYGNQFYGACATNLRPQVSPSTTYGCNITVQNSSVYSRGFLAGVINYLNFSIDAFLTNGGVDPVAFQRLCMSEALNDLWVSNTALLEEGVLWQYYGDATSGLLRYHPYADCSLNNPLLCNSRAYDPRFRPWYVSAISGSKVVYVLIHSTQNASFSLMQRAAEDIISTLTHRDFIQVQFAGSTLNTNDFQRSDNFTRETVRSFVRSQQFSSVQSDLTQAFNAAFGMFQGSRTTTSTCHRTLILFTDSALQQTLVDDISQLEQNLRSTGYTVDIYTYSFGGITVDPTTAQQIACDNQGQWFPVNSQSELESAIHSYYNFYAASVQNSGVVWSEFFTDVLTHRELISACFPLYDPATVESAPLLLGVTCLEVDPQRFYNFPDGNLVLQSLTNTDTTFCPTRQITEQKREALRITKCLPPPSTTAQELAELFRLAVLSSSQLHSNAFTAVTQQAGSATPNTVQCPFGYPLYDSCDVTLNLAHLFAPSEEFQDNVSFAGLGVILAPAIEDLLRNGSLNLSMYTSNQPLYASLCPAVVEERAWQRTRTRWNNRTNLQFFASEDGFLVTYPARQLDPDFCRTEMYDPRLRPFYASTAAGYKDVVIIIDLHPQSIPSQFAASLYSRPVLELLLTLSPLDYFNIIAGNASFHQSLVKANSSQISEADTFLSTISYTSIDQHLQLERGFSSLSAGRANGESSQCQSAIIVITNREITGQSVDQAQSLNRAYLERYSDPVKVFVNTFASQPEGRTELELVCNNSGIWNVILPPEFGNLISIIQKVTSYYKVLANAINFRDPIWSEVYTDAFGVGEVSTVCLPVYDNAVNIGMFLGVSCVDVPLSLFQQYPGGVTSLNSLISSQRNPGQCNPLTLSLEEINSFRPQALQCPPPPPSTLAPPSATTQTTQTGGSSGTSSPDNAGTEQHGAIVGIIFGIIGFFVIVAIVVAVIVACIHRWRNRQRETTIAFSNKDVLHERLLDEEEEENEGAL